MTTAPFFKYHGLANDFIVIREADAGDTLDLHAASWVEALCDRHRGVGADGILVLSRPESAEADARMVIYNRDGSRPEMCGNGVRCVVRHLVQNEDFAADELTIVSDAGSRHCRVTDAEPSHSKVGTWQVSVEMGEAEISTGPVHVAVGGFEAQALKVDMGNPHAVFFERPAKDTIDRVGRMLNDKHPDFPEGVNVEFVERTGPNTLRVDVFERGVGRTMACGTGACAAASAAIDRGVCGAQDPVDVELPGGTLHVEIVDEVVWMTGPVDYVFRGEISADWLKAQTSHHGPSAE